MDQIWLHLGERSQIPLTIHHSPSWRLLSACYELVILLEKSYNMTQTQTLLLRSSQSRVGDKRVNRYSIRCAKFCRMSEMGWVGPDLREAPGPRQSLNYRRPESGLLETGHHEVQRWSSHILMSLTHLAVLALSPSLLITYSSQMICLSQIPDSFASNFPWLPHT